MSAEIIEFTNDSQRDAVATLRKVADQIEAGFFGEVDSVALCVLGSTFEVIGMGDDRTGEKVSLLLQAGVQRIANAIESHGKP